MKHANLLDRIQAALENGADPGDGLDQGYLWRVESPIELENGSIRFTVERHPHIFGRSSRGTLSPAYRPVRRTYELSAHGTIEVVGVETGAPVVNVEQLAQASIDAWKQGLNVPLCCPELLECEDLDSAKAAAEVMASEIDWYDDFPTADDGPEPDTVLEETIDDVVARCKELAAEFLVEEWEFHRAK